MSQFYHPILGGIERHVQSLGAALAARGHSVAVATLLHPGLPDFEMDGEVRVYRVRGTLQRFNALFSGDRFHAPSFPDAEIAMGLRRVIAQEQPDIIHAHNWIVHSFLPLKSWSQAGLVMTLHDSEMTCVQMRRMYKDEVYCTGPGALKCLSCAVSHYGAVKGAVTLLGNRMMNGFEREGVDVFIPVSSAVAETNGLTGGSLPPGKVRVIPNFIPDDVGNPEEGNLGLEGLPDEPFILQVGDLVPDKGIFVLLEAYQKLLSAPPLVLIGRRTPDSPRELPPNVFLLESLPHNLVMQAWRRSLFGVVPSICLDASPTVTLEAMACGRSVVGSRIGGIVDQVIDGQTGMLVAPGDAAELAEAMQCLIDHPEVREQMGKAAQERVTGFMAGNVVSKIEEVYQSL
ncbi:MAG TPA: glycosyltransferase family 4 protein [Anaerolineaceae bacterium]